MPAYQIPKASLRLPDGILIPLRGPYTIEVRFDMAKIVFYHEVHYRVAQSGWLQVRSDAWTVIHHFKKIRQEARKTHTLIEPEYDDTPIQASPFWEEFPTLVSSRE